MADNQSPAYLSLDRRGVIRSMKPKARAIFDSYFSSDYSQSTMFYGQVVSLAKDIQTASENEDVLAEKIRTSLALIYGRYFFSVDLNVQVLDHNEEEGQWNIKVNMNLADEEGQQINLAAIGEVGSGLENKIKWIEEAQ